MDAIYTRGSALATRLLTKYNQGEYILSRAGQNIPASNEWDLPTVLPPQKWTLYGISSKVHESYVGKTGMNGTVITASDRQVLVASFADEPKAGDVFSINGKLQTVLDIDKVTEIGLAWRIVIKG